MARRAILRRRSRKSGNLTELDGNSEIFDQTTNPTWWKNLPDSMVQIPSSSSHIAERSVLNSDSSENEGELQDHWWENLQRTNLQSSRRYSTRKSLKPDEAVQESLISDGVEDVSIKKRKVLLRARENRSDGTEHFRKALEDSDVAQSEPLPSKKRKSTTTLDAEFLQSKIRTRQSRSLVDGEKNNNSETSSIDTDVIVKTRPQAFKTRATKRSTNVYDQILSQVDPSDKNSSKNTSTADKSLRSRVSQIANSSKNVANQTPVKEIDSNESGFMRPPLDDSHRKRLSSVSRTLHMTSSESEIDAVPSKPRTVFQRRSKKNDSFNPFDEILSGHVNESSSSVGTLNKSELSARTTTPRMSKSFKQNQMSQISTEAQAREKSEEASASESQSRVMKRTNNEDLNDDDEIIETQEHRSPLVASRARLSGKFKKNMIEDIASSQFIIPDTQDDPRQSIDRDKNSTIINESIDIEERPQILRYDREFSISTKINPRSSKRLTKEVAIDDATQVTEDLRAITDNDSQTASLAKKNDKNLQRRTILKNSSSNAERLQSQLVEDSESSGTEDDGDEKKRKKPAIDVANKSSSSQKVPRVSVNPSSSTEITGNKQTGQLKIATEDDQQEKLQKLRKSRSLSIKSHTQIREDSAYELPNRERTPSPIMSVSESDSLRKSESSNNAARNSSINKSISRNKSNIGKKESEKVLKTPEKSKLDVSVANKSTSRTNIVDSQISEEQNSDQSHVTDVTQENDNLGESISDAETEIAENETLESTNENSGTNNSKTFESRSSLPNASKKREGSDESDAEEESNLMYSTHSKNKSETSGKVSAHVSKNRIDSDESNSKEESNLKSTNRSKNKSRTSEKVSAQVSRNRIDSDGSDNDEESNLMSTNRSKNESGASGKGSAHVSANRIDSNDSNSEEESNLKSTRQSKNKSGASRKSSAHDSRNLIDSDEIDSEEESNLKSTNQSKNKSRVSEKVSAQVSRNRIDSDESDNDEESNLMSTNRSKNESGASGRASAHVSANRTDSDEIDSEEESNLKSKNQSKNKSVVGRKSSARFSTTRIDSDVSTKQGTNVKRTNRSVNESVETKKRFARLSRRSIETDESDTAENTKNNENVSPTLSQSTTKSISNTLKPSNATKRQGNSNSTVENTTASITIPSEEIPKAPDLSILSKNTSVQNPAKTQKKITDFLPSAFLQRTNNTKQSGSSLKFDKEQLDLVKKEVERKRQFMMATNAKKAAEAKQTSVRQGLEIGMNAKKFRPKENTSKAPAKPPKVVDKAYIVNGQVYKRPKLPRPKPWVTDRLYAHLWKKMEPKCGLRTRVKSERFMQQLADVVSLTIRRKKYDSYKKEIDALMKEMARLDIIETRNDFYNFCYDYMPNNFRLKVTPMLLPGCIENIPYDPATLHTPLIPES